VRRFRWLALLVTLGLVVAACGRSSSSSSGDSSTTATTGAAQTKSPDFGTQKDVCQAGHPSGSPTQGVTPTSIKIATFADPGFAGRPGLDQEFFDTADVFAAWCNARGGINGRKIEVDKKDSALTNTKARMTEACADDFAMVGGGSVFDQDGVETRLKCLLPDIAGYVVSPEARGADLLVQPIPNPLDSLGIGLINYLGAKYKDATQHIGVLTGDISTTKIVAQQQTEAVKSLGWKIVYSDQYPAAGVTDWTPYAQAIKSAGVKGLLWVGEPENLAALMKSLANIDYKLEFIRTDANHYDQKLISIAGPALSDKNVYVQSSFFPFEKASATNATGQYLQAFKDYKPDGKSNTYLGLQAWSAWLLFSQAAKECGNDLTRTCMYDNARKITKWTGGGLHAETNPGQNAPVECFTAELATPDGFKLQTDIKPTQSIFNCSPKNIYKLTGNYGTGVTLADVGQNIKNMK
jgi:ABC-type branched-subunit amino acid transport system substrate-binding protein